MRSWNWLSASALLLGLALAGSAAAELPTFKYRVLSCEFGKFDKSTSECVATFDHCFWAANDGAEACTHRFVVWCNGSKVFDGAPGISVSSMGGPMSFGITSIHANYDFPVLTSDSSFTGDNYSTFAELHLADRTLPGLCTGRWPFAPINPRIQ